MDRARRIVPVARFPQRIVPMEPELAPEPFHPTGWGWEKLDGWRRSPTRTAPGCGW